MDLLNNIESRQWHFKTFEYHNCYYNPTPCPKTPLTSASATTTLPTADRGHKTLRKTDHSNSQGLCVSCSVMGLIANPAQTAANHNTNARPL